MKHQRHIRLYVISIIVVVLSFIARSSSDAQDARPIVTLGVPEYFLSQFQDSIGSRLQQIVPDVRINLVRISPVTRPPNDSWLDDYYKNIEANVNAADILFVTPFDITAESTRAGYFLDLKPLADIDTDLATSDFVPAAWMAYQWDNSIWAIPSFFSSNFLVYDPVAFDQASLNYPSANWTMDDLAAAARNLSIKGNDGETSVPGLFIDEASLAVLFRSLLKDAFYDSTSTPTMPRIARPDLAALIQLWSTLEAEGSVTTQFNSAIYNKIPLRIGTVHDLENRSNESGSDQRILSGALFPNGTSLLNVIGFAVSKGTIHPEQSFKVIKALTAMPEMRALFGGSMAARLSVQALTTEGEYQLSITPKERAFVEDTAKVGLSASDLLYGNYLAEALSRVKAGDDPLVALQAVESRAKQVLQTAEQKSKSVAVAVATPIPESLPDDKPTLTFGIFTGSTSLLFSADWQKAIDEFVANDPQIGRIKLTFVAPVTSDWGKKVGSFVDTTDCFYPGFIGLDSFADKVLSLDALMNADPNFTRDDMLNGVLRELELDNHVMGFPLSIMPAMMRYDILKFKNAGVPLPTNGWTINDFTDALTALRTQNPNEPALYPYLDIGRYLLLLMAANGALPIDWRTNPVTINYTDPKVVEGIRQVLDLAKTDAIRYSKLASFIFNINVVSSPIVIETFSSLSGVNKSTGLTTFPRGTEFIPSGYNLDAAYISANTLIPEACYRWIQTLAHHPKLFLGIPASRSVINDPITEALYGHDTFVAFQRFVELLAAPNALVVHDRTEKLGVATLWLLRAFDNYVLKNANLEEELIEAERFTKEYMGCVAALGQPFNKTVPGAIYIEDQCANKIDPTFMEIFAPSHG